MTAFRSLLGEPDALDASREHAAELGHGLDREELLGYSSDEDGLGLS